MLCTPWSERLPRRDAKSVTSNFNMCNAFVQLIIGTPRYHDGDGSENGSSVVVSFSTALQMRPSRNKNVDLDILKVSLNRGCLPFTKNSGNFGWEFSIGTGNGTCRFCRLPVA